MKKWLILTLLIFFAPTPLCATTLKDTLSLGNVFSNALDNVREVVSDVISNPRYEGTHKKLYRTPHRPNKPKQKFPRKIVPTGTQVFIFDPKRLGWAAYNADGKLIKSGRASGGMRYCSDIKQRCQTPAGKFKVYRKGSAECTSNKFPLGKGGAPMPYCMFFHGGYAIHGSPDVPDFNASHGCIRVHPDSAQWLHANFMKPSTTVIIKPY